MESLKKSELINIIQSLPTFESPKIQYEQYITDAIATCDFLYHIAFEQHDLINEFIVDLGCGTGNLSIGSALIGAKKVLGVDIDKDALAIYQSNVQSLELTDKIECIQREIGKDDITTEVLKKKAELQDPNLRVITISNPPFGVHNKGIDLLFLKQALKFSDVIYSIHLANDQSRQYLTKQLEKLGAKITARATLYLILKGTYKFHKQNQKKIQTDVYRIIKSGNIEKKNDE